MIQHIATDKQVGKEAEMLRGIYFSAPRSARLMGASHGYATEVLLHKEEGFARRMYVCCCFLFFAF